MTDFLDSPSPSTVPRCSVVVRCYNEERHIGKLLSGIMEQSVQDVQIVIVDSGSTDRTVEIAQHYPVDLVSIRKEDFSFGYSLNAGCKAARGKIVVLASAHVYPTYRDWLERLIAPFEDPQVALTYGKQRGDEDTHFSEQRIFRAWFPDHSDLRQTDPFCNNANAAIRRSLWEKMPYDEILTGLEDLSWAKQALAQGHRIAYVAEAEIIHVHDETSAQIFRRYEREAIALKAIYSDSGFSLGSFLRLATQNIWSDWLAAAKGGKLLGNLFDIARFRTLQFWGTYRGYRQYGRVDDQLRMRFYYPPETTAKRLEQELRRPGATPIDYVLTGSEMTGKAASQDSQKTRALLPE
ncbi:MAG: glycosyltransferase family 2 protein [Deltaproteobacteria bacterium]|nr:glycosyltransferase family 2 protein [Deltaproteobacteria bacterium]